MSTCHNVFKTLDRNDTFCSPIFQQTDESPIVCNGAGNLVRLYFAPSTAFVNGFLVRFLGRFCSKKILQDAAIGNFNHLTELFWRGIVDQANPITKTSLTGRLNQKTKKRKNNFCNCVCSIPSEIGSLVNLKLLVLTDGSLSGRQLKQLIKKIYSVCSIPSTLAKCSHLELLNLSNNNLTHNIPAEVYWCGSCFN